MSDGIADVAVDSAPVWRGIFPASLTMFTADGDLDEPAQQRHIDYLIGSGVHGIVATGTSGEFIALTNPERTQVTRTIIESVDGRVPVLASTGHYSTHHTIELTQEAERLGADGALLILPYYQRPPKPAILNHYRAVRRHTGLPLWVYNNPVYAACDPITTVELAELYDEGVIAGVKSTLDSVVPIHELLNSCGEGLRTFYGTFQAPLEALLVGAHGWISGFINFLTRQCVDLYEAAATGNVQHGKAIWAALLPFKQLYSQQRLGPVNDLAIYRAGLDLMGMHGGYSRLPFEPLNDEQRGVVRALMIEQGIL